MPAAHSLAMFSQSPPFPLKSFLPPSLWSSLSRLPMCCQLISSSANTKSKASARGGRFGRNPLARLQTECERERERVHAQEREREREARVQLNTFYIGSNSSGRRLFSSSGFREESLKLFQEDICRSQGKAKELHKAGSRTPTVAFECVTVTHFDLEARVVEAQTNEERTGGERNNNVL